jgi:hypothetical protein
VQNFNANRPPEIRFRSLSSPAWPRQRERETEGEAVAEILASIKERHG